MLEWDGISLVDKPVDVATTSVGGFTPLIAANGQMKIEAPPRYFGKRRLGVRMYHLCQFVYEDRNSRAPIRI